MSQDTDLERREIATAIIGLRDAFKRCMDAYRDLIPNHAIAGVSVAEFVFWACALDERLSETDRAAYEARRDGDQHGQVLAALRFTRDRHTHQVAITTSLEFTFERSSDSDSPDLLQLKTRWRPLDGITKPTGHFATTHGYRTGLAAYKEHLEGQKPVLALRAALDFLNREVAARGIELHDANTLTQ